MLGRLEEATERFRLACDLAPDLPETHRKLGVLLWKRGLPKEAAQHNEACLKLDPDQPAVRDFLGAIRSKRAFTPQPTGSPGS
jgi:Flp pilus assembly protein TadD